MGPWSALDLRLSTRSSARPESVAGGNVPLRPAHSRTRWVIRPTALQETPGWEQGEAARGKRRWEDGSAWARKAARSAACVGGVEVSVAGGGTARTGAGSVGWECEQEEEGEEADGGTSVGKVG